MVVAEVSIVPLGTGSPSVSSYVAGALEVLRREKNVRYELTAMGTIIEGDLDSVLAAVRKMHECPFTAGAGRVLTTIKIDDRRDKEHSMDAKLRSVKQKMKQ